MHCNASAFSTDSSTNVLFCSLIFQHVGKLLRAYDIEVLELAISVIFYACLPSTSLTSSPLETDWKEGVEVCVILHGV